MNDNGGVRPPKSSSVVDVRNTPSLPVLVPPEPRSDGDYKGCRSDVGLGVQSSTATFYKVEATHEQL